MTYENKLQAELDKQQKEDFTKMHASERKRPTYTELLEWQRDAMDILTEQRQLIQDQRAALKIARDILTDALENEGKQ